MTKEEAKAYAQKLLKESGASDEDVTQYLKLLDNDKFAQGFIPRPEVDRSLDAERQKSKTHADRNAYLETEWLPQAKAAYDKNLKGIQMLEKYQQMYGAIDDDAGNIQHVAETTGLTMEKVTELLNSNFAARDRATLDFMDIREDYANRFKKRFPLKDFEKHVETLQRSGDYQGLRSAYKDWIEPELEKATPHRFSEEELKARDKRIADEATKDFASRNKIPIDSRPREPHLLFENVKKANGDAGKSGRDAFLEVLNDPDPDTVRSRYPV